MTLTGITLCPRCSAKGWPRPYVVWFGETPLQMDTAYTAVGRRGLFISVGAAGNVYPAAGFVQEARTAKARTVELNLKISEGASLFAEKIYGPGAGVAPAYVDKLLAQGL